MNVELVPEDRSAPPLGKIILLFPRFSAPQYPVFLPLEIMTIATSLWKAGYRVRVLDERMEPDAEKIFLREAEDALFAGCSARPGDQVIRVWQIFSELKRRSPETVTVFGGWFPTTFTKACIDLEPVDIVVQGQADHSVVELAHSLRLDQDLTGLAGVISKLKGVLIRNPRRPLENIEETPRIPYDRFPVRKYVTFDGCLNYYSSRGCPAACEFCSVPVAYPEQWTGYSASRVLEEMESLVTGYGVKIFKIHDVDFFPDFDRAKEICRGFIDRNLNIRWIVDVRVNEIIRFDDEMWDLLQRSGCRELETGGESGCDKQLEYIAKECTSEQIFRAAQLAVAHEIPIRINFILGLHGEDRKKLMDTLNCIGRVQSLSDQVKLQFYRYTPAPSTKLGLKTWKLVTRGHDGSVPEDAESIVSLPLNHDQAKLFWLSRTHERRVKRFYYFYLPYVYYIRGPGSPGIRGWVRRRLLDGIKIRLKYGITAFPFEQWIYRLAKLKMPRSRNFEWEQETC